MHPETLFDFFRHMTETDESKIIYILCLVCIVMVMDFLIGTAAAWFNKETEFNSSTGIRGIVRKLANMGLLVICLPISVLIPDGIGMLTLGVLYTGYLVMEFYSIIENLDSMGVKISLLKKFIAPLEEKIEEAEAEKEGDADE